ncbi:HIRAN domain-containing protein [Telluribacter humicola]|uniref:HIRAN domain-containing protein n=1 Tax=Telluribacter humicola TaxID=1720261 RepID=UPI001A96BD9A|nr:HIRAN domain-containing protein [Telluribacter humicola]
MEDSLSRLLFLLLKVVLGFGFLYFFYRLYKAGRAQKRSLPVQREEEELLMYKNWIKPIHYKNVEIMGLYHYKYEMAKRKGYIHEDSPFTLRRSFNIKQDSFAVEVYVNEYKLGYLPDTIGKEIALKMELGETFKVRMVGHFPKRQFGQLEIDIVNERLEN